jgi:hypothetical protein
MNQSDIANILHVRHIIIPVIWKEFIERGEVIVLNVEGPVSKLPKDVEMFNAPVLSENKKSSL